MFRVRNIFLLTGFCGPSIVSPFTGRNVGDLVFILFFLQKNIGEKASLNTALKSNFN